MSNIDAVYESRPVCSILDAVCEIIVRLSNLVAVLGIIVHLLSPACRDHP